MNKAKKYSKVLELVRWFWCIPAAIMYVVTYVPFGTTAALVLALMFGGAFYFICSRGRMHIISEDIVNDIKKSLKGFGQENSIFEVKGFTFGLVVRVYLFRANVKTPMCTKVIMDRIARGWYKNMVWVAQVVDLSEKSQLKKLQKELDQALITALEKERNDKKQS